MKNSSNRDSRDEDREREGSAMTRKNGGGREMKIKEGDHPKIRGS